MEQLKQMLQDQHGLTPEQSHGVLNTVIEFIKNKFPMASGIMDQLSGRTSTTQTQDPTSKVQEPTSTTPEPAKTGGGIIEEIEEFAKDKLGI